VNDYIGFKFDEVLNAGKYVEDSLQVDGDEDEVEEINGK
jgi:hypothetical protein